MLYVVGTPIGNEADFSSRAKDILTSVDLIACEDTRTTALFLSRFSIRNQLISYHEHNRAKRNGEILQMLQDGKNIALVSDAGMPCISDPGAELVRVCRDEKMRVTVIPGPVAAVSALVVSGLDTRRFFFEGFLPVSGKERKERLSELADTKHTFVLYEAPHRLLRTLDDLNKNGFAERDMTICRELTKKYEEIIYTTVSGAADVFSSKEPKGEFVLVIAGAPAASKVTAFDTLGEEEKSEAIIERKERGMSTKEIAKELSGKWKIPQKQVYQMVIQLAEDLV